MLGPDYVEQMRRAIVAFRSETEDMGAPDQATALAWLALMEGILHEYSPKVTQRIERGQVSPPARDVAAGAAGSGPGT